MFRIVKSDKTLKKIFQLIDVSGMGGSRGSLLSGSTAAAKYAVAATSGVGADHTQSVGNINDDTSERMSISSAPYRSDLSLVDPSGGGSGVHHHPGHPGVHHHQGHHHHGGHGLHGHHRGSSSGIPGSRLSRYTR